MDKLKLEMIANNALMKGLALRKTDLDLARNYMATSWGMNWFLDRDSFLYLCDNLLQDMDLTKYGAMVCERQGAERVQKAFKLFKRFYKENLFEKDF